MDVTRRDEEHIVNRLLLTDIPGTRKKGPKITLKDACEQDMWLNADKQGDMEEENQQPDEGSHMRGKSQRRKTHIRMLLCLAPSLVEPVA